LQYFAPDSTHSSLLCAAAAAALAFSASIFAALAFDLAFSILRSAYFNNFLDLLFFY